MTNEQYTILKKYEAHLKSAQEGWMRGLGTAELKELDALYKELLPNKQSKLLNGCSRCILHSLQDLAKEFFAYVPPKPKKKNKKEEITEENGKEDKS